jgi:hypothetical protein
MTIARCSARGGRCTTWPVWNSAPTVPQFFLVKLGVPGA